MTPIIFLAFFKQFFPHFFISSPYNPYQTTM